VILKQLLVDCFVLPCSWSKGYSNGSIWWWEKTCMMLRMGWACLMIFNQPNFILCWKLSLKWNGY